MTRAICIEYLKYVFDLLLLKNKVTFLQQNLEFPHIKCPRAICVKLLEYLLNCKVALSFSLIKAIFLGHLRRIPLFKPVKCVKCFELAAWRAFFVRWGIDRNWSFRWVSHTSSFRGRCNRHSRWWFWLLFTASCDLGFVQGLVGVIIELIEQILIHFLSTELLFWALRCNKRVVFWEIRL